MASPSSAPAPVVTYNSKGGPGSIPKAMEEALILQQKKTAFKECSVETKAYVSCTNESTLSALWKCRDLLKGMNECLHKYTNEESLEVLRQKYMRGELTKQYLAQLQQEDTQDRRRNYG